MSIATKNTITNSVRMIPRNNNNHPVQPNHPEINNNSSNSSHNNRNLANSQNHHNLKESPLFLNNMLSSTPDLNNNNNYVNKECTSYESALPILASSEMGISRGGEPGKGLEGSLRNVLVIYTGGTIGMVRLPGFQGLVPVPRMLEQTVRSFPNLHDEKYAEACFGLSEDKPMILPEIQDATCRVAYKIVEYDPLLDSTNMTMVDWINIARDIKKFYNDYDGFVVLHGTDTMSYTASALSFMLENLGKSVVVTGSQIPLFESRSDGRENFLGALIMAGHYLIPEVTVFFGNRLFRGNRITKVSSDRLNAFDSPNLSPLATLGINIQVDYNNLFLEKEKAVFGLNTGLNPHVALLRLYPSITAQTVRSFLQAPMAGVVLQTYGAGNFPTNPALLAELEAASARGLILVNCTQCGHGSVSAIYETGKKTEGAGVIPGWDMTPEAALTKLSYVLGRSDWALEVKREKMQESLRGELTRVIAKKSSQEVVINLSEEEPVGLEKDKIQRFAKKVGTRLGLSPKVANGSGEPGVLNNGKVAEPPLAPRSPSIQLDLNDLAILLGSSNKSQNSSWATVAGIILASQLLLVFCLAVLL